MRSELSKYIMKNRETHTWPDGKRFAVCLTHDVDRVKKTYQYLTHFAKTLRPYHFLSMFQKEEPYWNFERIIEIEEKYGVKSTFFFLNETKNIDLLHPKNWALSLEKYDFHDEKIAEIIQKLYGNGWEIGLHGSYDSYKNKDMLAREKKELEDIVGDEIIGIRQHYLNLEIPHTWKIQKEVGFKYDASFGSNYEIGFREEKYLPFHPFDDQFLVIPLTIMDTALFRNSKSINDAWTKCQDLIEQAEKRGALMTVLWHQRVFNEKEFPGWGKIYEKMIRVCKEKGAWLATAKDITDAKCWTHSDDENFAELPYKGQLFRIEKATRILEDFVGKVTTFRAPAVRISATTLKILEKKCKVGIWTIYLNPSGKRWY